MRFITTLAAAAALTISGVAATAGGLSDQIMEAPVAMEEPMAAPAASSISPTYVVLGVLAALVIAAAVNANDDDDDEEEDDTATASETDTSR